MAQLKCKACAGVQELKRRGIWVHQGLGKLSDMELSALAKRNELRVMGDQDIHDFEAVDDFFMPREEWLRTRYKDDFGDGLVSLNCLYGGDRSEKPCAGFWASHGDWPLGLQSTCDEHEDGLDGCEVLAVSDRDLKHILAINTLDEMRAFVAKYGRMVKSKEQRERDSAINYAKSDTTAHITEVNVDKAMNHYSKKCGVSQEYIHELFGVALNEDWKKGVDMLEKVFTVDGVVPEIMGDGWHDWWTKWRGLMDCLDYYSVVSKKMFPEHRVMDKNQIDFDRVREDGYAGISFGFANVSELGLDWSQSRDEFRWHSGYDVTSLMVWDTERAFGNRVYPVTLKMD